MNDLRFKCRASALGGLMTKSPDTKGARETVLNKVLFDGYGWLKNLDVKQIKKGKELEATAIDLVGKMNFINIEKNTERLENDWFTGECDIFTENSTRDTKVSWSVDSFPWTDEDAKAAVKSNGYDWQGFVYNMLWGKTEHYVDFVLLPTPEHMLGYGDDPYQHIDLVQGIPIEKRVRSVKIVYSEELILQAQERVEYMQDYYNDLWYNIVSTEHDE